MTERGNISASRMSGTDSAKLANRIRRHMAKPQIERVPIRDRYCVTVPVAMEFVGLSRSTLWELIKAGELESKLLHGRRVILVASLIRMVDGAPVQS